jgi:hypothetical protein
VNWLHALWATLVHYRFVAATVGGYRIWKKLPWWIAGMRAAISNDAEKCERARQALEAIEPRWRWPWQCPAEPSSDADSRPSQASGQHGRATQPSQQGGTAMTLLRKLAAMNRRPQPEPGPLLRPVGCECGRVFSSASACQVHRDGDRCMECHVWEGQLIQIDGVWHLRGATP